MHCDVTDLTTLAEIVTRFGVRRIVHTAAMLSTGIRQDPARGVHVNVMGTTNVLEIARTRGIERVVCASSTTVAYTGFGRHGPEAIEEDIPLHVVSERPASIYAATKLAGEHLAYLYNDLYGLDVIVLRYTAVLGGGSEPPSSVPGRLLARLAHGGKTGEKVVLDDPFVLWGGREEFVDARDCARANVCALDAVTPAQKVFNIAPGTWFSLGEFIDVVRRVHPRLRRNGPLISRPASPDLPIRVPRRRRSWPHRGISASSVPSPLRKRSGIGLEFSRFSAASESGRAHGRASNATDDRARRCRRTGRSHAAGMRPGSPRTPPHEIRLMPWTRIP